MIELKSLTKEFEEKGKSRASAHNGVFRAVDELSLTVEPGEIFGLLGSNGAGKTTTLRMLATMLRPTSGTADVAGFDIVKQPEQVRRSIGVLFGGDTGLYDRLTARENIEYFARLYDMEEQQIKKRVEELCDIFEMGDYIDARCAKFSRGMKQKLAITGALIHEPSIWVLDEPMVGLDPQSVFMLKEEMRRHADSGRTVFFSTHVLDVAERLCDEIGIIKRGRLIARGTLDELRHGGDSSLEEVFLELVEKKGE